MNPHFLDLLLAQPFQIYFDLAADGIATIFQLGLLYSYIFVDVVPDGENLSIFMIEYNLFLVSIALPFEVLQCPNIDVLIDGQNFHNVIAFFFEYWQN